MINFRKLYEYKITIDKKNVNFCKYVFTALFSLCILLPKELLHRKLKNNLKPTG